ncbi:MAG: protein kinase, partial [Eubacteriales bacterium]|nr:protein kinase [Eubacteriales bacterium]
IIHRDISPDNIFMTKDGQVKLIDFGAARQLFGDNKSISVTLKPGYAPEEQYRARGNQGPWTDVYALSATLYRMVTGNTPPESIERVMDDELVIPEYLSANVRYALKKGMAVKAADRFENISEFQNAIVSGNQAENNGAKPLAADAPLSNTMSVKAFDSENEHNGKNKSDTPSTQKHLKIALGSIVAALVICIDVLLGIVIGSNKETPTDVGVTSKNKQKTTQSTSSASDRKSSNSKANANSSSSSSSSAQTAPAQQPTQKTVDRAADERLLYTTIGTNLNAYVNGVNTGDTSAVSGYIDSSTEFYRQEVEQIKSYYAKGVRERLISYNIVNVEWIDDDSCYLTQHSVIEVNRNGKVKNADETYTYLMRRIGGKFYYIKPTDR